MFPEFTIIVMSSLFPLLLRGSVDEDLKRLHKKIMHRYNRNVLPSKHPLIPVELFLGLRLEKIVDIDNRNQVMTTNVWLIHQWVDSKLTWDPREYGNVERIEIPSSMIWLPDVVLYNNADGTFVVDTFNWAHVFCNGTVKWSTPVTFKSHCGINIQYYPFDIQNCTLKFGVWSHGKKQIILRHESGQVIANPGVDLSSYEESIEWDLLAAPAIRHEIGYECCPGDEFLDITFCLEIRRKSLFYTVNLIAPCVCIAFLAIMVFHVPSASGEKMTLSISILVALQVFYLLMIEILPSTSLHVPLLGKYLLFTFVFVSASIILALVIVNIHFRDPKMHRMPFWCRLLFFEKLPPLLLMDKPTFPAAFIRLLDNDSNADQQSSSEDDESTNIEQHLSHRDASSDYSGLRAIRKNIRLINKCKRSEVHDKIITDAWAYVALVMDRICLIIYALTFIIGTAACLFTAPTLYDNRKSLTANLS
ncbi:hypothetical protein GJ496_002746 [Pomphorhynchus laevis]|nr:hypothetical protein GJ496_002746 [Pomphorhynchus laevis]